MRGDEYRQGEDLEAVAALIGVDYHRSPILPAHDLATRYVRVLTVAVGLIVSMSDARLWQRALASRDRPLIGLAFHTIDLCPKLLNGYPRADLDKSEHEQRPADMDTVAKLVAFGEESRSRFERWWADEGHAADLDRLWATYYGQRRWHRVLERQVWHTTHHTRQLQDVVVREGTTPADPLGDADLAGLPLPYDVWE